MIGNKGYNLGIQGTNLKSNPFEERGDDVIQVRQQTYKDPTQLEEEPKIRLIVTEERSRITGDME